MLKILKRSVNPRKKKEVDADHGLLTNHLARSVMTSEGTPVTLKTPQQGQRRGSFLYRSEVNEDSSQPQQQQQQFLATPSLSTKSHSNTSSVSASPTCTDHSFQEDPIITPFAQILQRLQIARNSYVELTKVTDRRRRRSSNYSEAAREVNYNTSVSTTSNKYPEEFCLEILDDLDWCLDQLEAIQTNKSVGDLATIKFKKILTKELNQLAVSSKSGSLISEYISNTFFDKEDESQLDSEAVALPSPASSTATAASTTPTAAASSSSQRTIMCDIPGLRPLNKDGLFNDQGTLPMFGVAGLDEQKVGQYMAGLTDWNFDIFQLDDVTNRNSLVVMAYTVFKERNLLSTFRIPLVAMATYFTHIQNHYGLDSFYHNRMHAADVTHAVHVILSKAPQLAIFSDLEILSALFAAVIHDVDHPGVTNPYLINTNADLALMYNDESVLENHHLAVAFKLLQGNNCDIFVNLPLRTRQRMRKMVIDMVLATDMTKHMSLLADLKTKVETKKLSGADLLVTDNYNERMEVLKCLLHCADLGNPTKNLTIYNKWVDRVMKEFFNQGDIERGLGLEISPMCDRYTASIEKSQVSFIDYIVHPLWETWAELVDPYCNDVVDTIVQNKKHFENLAAQKCTSPVLKQGNEEEDDEDEKAGTSSEKPLFVFEHVGDEPETSAERNQQEAAEGQRNTGRDSETQKKSHFVPSNVTITIQKE